LKKIVLKYGLIAGIILAGMIFTMMAVMGDTADFEKGESFGYLFMVGAFSMIFLGIREYRDKISDGTINFNHGFRVGILITLIASACYVAGWMIYFNFIDHSFVEKYTIYFTEKIKSSGKTPDEIEKEIRSFKTNMVNYKNPFVMAMYTLLEVFPIGLIITILCSFLMSRLKKSVPAT
jgi:Protein of unknown function (DUF4199)